MPRQWDSSRISLRQLLREPGLLRPSSLPHQRRTRNAHKSKRGARTTMQHCKTRLTAESRRLLTHIGLIAIVLFGVLVGGSIIAEQYGKSDVQATLPPTATAAPSRGKRPRGNGNRRTHANWKSNGLTNGNGNGKNDNGNGKAKERSQSTPASRLKKVPQPKVKAGGRRSLKKHNGNGNGHGH